MLDVLKGLGCVLMIFAHTGLTQAPTRLMIVIGGFAPLLFFTVSGVTAYLQAERGTPLPSVLLTYGLMFILGFTYNGMVYRFPSMDILQIIPVSSATIFGLRTFAKRIGYRMSPIVFLVMGVGLYFFKWLIDSPALHKLDSPWAGILFPPGQFPVLPWLAMFFLGVFAYFTFQRNNLLVLLGTLAVLVLLPALSIPASFDKWDMSVVYFLVSSLVIVGIFYIFRRNVLFRSRIILFWGQNSLLFLYVSFFWIVLLEPLMIAFLVDDKDVRIVVAWLGIALSTQTTMWLSLWLLKRPLWIGCFQNLPIWLGWAILGIVVNILLKGSLWVVFVDFALGATFAVHYPSLSLLSKRLFTKQ